MAATRKPGTECVTHGSPELDKGTSARIATSTPRTSSHASKKKVIAAKRFGMQFGVRDLQKSVRPHLYSAAYVKAASITTIDPDDVPNSLKALEQAADTLSEFYFDEYIQAYLRSPKAGENYLHTLAAQKERDMQEWHRKQHEERHQAEVTERVLNIGGAVLQTAKTVGLISTKALTVMTAGAGHTLDRIYTGVDIYAEVASHQPVLLVVGKETAKKGLETAAEKASEHLAERIEEKAAEAFSSAAKAKPWALKQPTSDYLRALGRAEKVKLVGKHVFTVYDVGKAIHEAYEAWEKVFEHEEKSHGEHH
jgi:hypothetical protein